MLASIISRKAAKWQKTGYTYTPSLYLENYAPLKPRAGILSRHKRRISIIGIADEEGRVLGLHSEAAAVSLFRLDLSLRARLAAETRSRGHVPAYVMELFGRWQEFIQRGNSLIVVKTMNSRK